MTAASLAPSEGRAAVGRVRRVLPVTRFVLLSTQRSGTSWLMERLSKHPAVGGYGEALLHDARGPFGWPVGAGDRSFFPQYLSERGISATNSQRHLHLFGYLDDLYAPRRSLRAIGFKLMYDEARPYPELLVYFSLRDVRVVHLLRLNLLDIVISRVAMRQRRFVHAHSPEERESVRIRLPTDRLPLWLARLALERGAARLLVRAARLKVHEVTYEDLLADDVHLRRTLAFLGIADAADLDLTSLLLKLGSPSQRSSVTNYDEVCARLRRTAFACFLRD